MHEGFANANLAQSVEQLIRNEQVAGSIPAIGSNRNPTGSTPAGFLILLKIFLKSQKRLFTVYRLLGLPHLNTGIASSKISTVNCSGIYHIDIINIEAIVQWIVLYVLHDIIRIIEGSGVTIHAVVFCRWYH